MALEYALNTELAAQLEANGPLDDNTLVHAGRPIRVPYPEDALARQIRQFERDHNLYFCPSDE
jgi:hypothetical protein